jgi:hypothetical protein
MSQSECSTRWNAPLQPIVVQVHSDLSKDEIMRLEDCCNRIGA